MHSNVYDEIWQRPYRSWFRKHRAAIAIVAVLVLAFIVVLWLNKAYAMDPRAIHLCISTARELNQEATIHLDPQSCLKNPYFIR